MSKIRLRLTKGEAVKYIAHLDYSRAVERAVRRSGLPVAYSQGFNPHLRISFATALGAGTTSAGEYIELYLTQSVPIQIVAVKLDDALPPGIEVVSVEEVPTGTPSAAVLLGAVKYEFTFVWQYPITCNLINQSVMNFNRADCIEYCRISPKGKKNIDIKSYVKDPLTIMELTEKQAKFALTLRVGNTGSVRPNEFISVLVERFELPSAWQELSVYRAELLLDSLY